MPKKKPIILIIAGSDSCAGAGIQADLKIATALGCYALTVITTITAQNTLKVRKVFPLAKQVITEQLKGLVDDFDFEVIKIGMLYDRDIVEVVCEFLKQHGLQKKIILDPVMLPTNGRKNLLKKEALTLLEEQMLPLSFLITPNIKEAEVLAKMKIESFTDIEEAAKIIANKTNANVLIKGGDFQRSEMARDLLVRQGKKGTEGESLKWLSKKKINTENTHGTGCCFATAVSAFLAKGYGLEKSFIKAKFFIHTILKNSKRYSFGQGKGPLY